MGLSRAARFAGRKPNSTPIPTEMPKAAAMEMKAGLTFACMNLKKLARILAAKGRDTKESVSYLKLLINLLRMIQEKEKWCWA